MFRRLAALALISFVSLFGPTHAEADHQALFCGYNTSTGCLDVLNPAIVELRETGVHRFRIVQETSGSIEPAIRSGLQDYADRYAFFLVEDESSPYAQIMSGGTAFIYGNSLHGACGTWAIECLPNFPSTPTVAYNANVMQLWGFGSQREVVYHGVCHQLANCAEGYMEAYVYGSVSAAPIDDGGAVIVLAGLINPAIEQVSYTGQHRSVMNTGLFNRQDLDTYIDALWCLSHCIRNPAITDHGNYVTWCDADPKDTAVAMTAWDGREERYVGHIESGAGPGCHGAQTTAWLRPGEIACFHFDNQLTWRMWWTSHPACKGRDF